MEASEHPKSVTTAILRCSSIATAPGAEAVPEHAGIGTASITVKSVLLETTPVLLTTSRAKRRGPVRNDEGIFASISRALTKVDGTDWESRRTTEPASKPEPKIRTPLRGPGVLPLVVMAACGNRAPGIAGVKTCSMLTGLKEVLSRNQVKLSLPELATNAVFVAPSTSSAPESFRVMLTPELVKVMVFRPFCPVFTMASRCKSTGSSMETSLSWGLKATAVLVKGWNDTSATPDSGARPVVGTPMVSENRVKELTV